MKKYIWSSIFVILAIFAFYSFSYAQTTDELKTQIDNANTEIDKINKEIATLSSQIAVTAEQKNTLANVIKDLNLKKDKLVKERQQTEKKITATGLIIKTLNIQIDTKNTILNKSKNSLSSILKDLYQKDNLTFLQKILVSTSMSDLSREYNDLIYLNTETKNNINNISAQKEDLSSSKNTKENEQNALNTLKKSLLDKETEITINKKEKDSLLVATKNKESEYQKMLAEQLKRKDTFEKSIEDYEAQIKFILNPKSIPKAGSSPLSFPLTSITVTSPYGQRCFVLKGHKTCSFHYGLDFRATVGTSVKAMSAGIVEGTGNTDIDCKGASFGNWVFIKYNNGLSSTYGHLSSIIAKVGQKVEIGDIVGLSGGAPGMSGSGSSTGPHLHVAVYASAGVKVDTVPSKSCNGKIFTQPIAALSSYLDPALYLPPITANMIKK